MKRLLPALLFLAACDDTGGKDGGPSNKPQAFVTLHDANVIHEPDHGVTGTVNASGCKKVVGLDLFDGSTFLQQLVSPEGDTPLPVSFKVTGAAIANEGFFNQRGLATPLTLHAKVTCDDDRANEAQPVSANFFPVEWRRKHADGSYFVPVIMRAEGGLGGNATSFIGCAFAGNSAAQFVRVEENGTISVQKNLPSGMTCTLNTQISAQVNCTPGHCGTSGRGYWVVEPSRGAWLVNAETLDSISVAPVVADGTISDFAVDEASGRIVMTGGLNQTAVASYRAAQAAQAEPWSATLAGVSIARPVITADEVLVADFFRGLGDTTGVVTVSRYALEPPPSNDPPPPLSSTTIRTLSYPAQEQAIPPVGAFSASGQFFGLSLVFQAGQAWHTQVVWCGTSGGLFEVCTDVGANPTQKWLKDLDLPVGALLPLTDTVVAAASQYGVYFLDAQNGNILNKGGQPLRPTGTNIMMEIENLPHSPAFYITAGPQGGFANELIGTDGAAQGELFRVRFGTGTTPSSSMSAVFNVNNNLYLRLGTELAKVHPSTSTAPFQAYRTLRGPTP